MVKQSKQRAEKIRQRGESEAYNVFARLSSTYAASRTQGQRLLQRVGGLSIVEWRVLWDLLEAGPMTIRDLADLQRTDHSQLSRALPEMRRKGYVTMQRDSEDGRQTIVGLTEEGRAAHSRAAPVMQRRRDALRARFSAREMAQIVDYLERLEAFLRLPIDEVLEEKETVE